MDHNQNVLLSLCPGVLPNEINGVVIPSIYHCAGTDKLIGQYYGKAIFEDILCNNTAIEEKISILSVVIRAYIVIDDFIKDNDIIVGTDHVLQQWLINIQSYANDLISNFSDLPNEIWGTYYREYDTAYFDFDSSDMFNNIIKKCFLIYIPFSLEIINSNKRSETTYDFMKNYLFALQLLDDFQDMEEDISAPKNHNIFLSCIEPSLVNTVIDHKSIIAPGLLSFIGENLEKHTSLVKSNTILTFVKKNLVWIESQLSKIGTEHKELNFKGSFSEFNFNNIIPSFLDAVSKQKVRKTIVYKEIRAENMHTVTVL